jgi:hypothetical protein
MKIPQITPQVFFKVGVGSFSIIFLAKLYMYVMAFSLLTFPEHIVNIADLVFGLILAGFFYYLLKNSPSEPQTTFSLSEGELSEEDLNLALEEAKSGTKKKKRTRAKT